MTQKPDPHQTHNRLKAARRWRGFASATKAAEALGWSAGTYRVRESGIGALSETLARLYASGFGVSTEFLRTGLTVTENDVAASAFIGREYRTLNRQTPESIVRAASALSAVRASRGFDSMLSAARHFGFTYTTYRTHEAGISAIPARMASVYAFAYGVPTAAFDTAVQDFELTTETLRGGPVRTRDEVTSHAASLGRPETEQGRSSVDVRLFEDAGRLYETVRQSSAAPSAAEATISISASHVRRAGAAAEDLAVLRMDALGGTIELLLHLDKPGSEAEGCLHILLGQRSCSLVQAEDGMRRPPPPRSEQYAVRLPVLSLDLTAGVVLRLAADLFDPSNPSECGTVADLRVRSDEMEAS